MNWQSFYIHQRLVLDPFRIEDIYSTIAKIDSVKQSWQITGKLLLISIYDKII